MKISTGFLIFFASLALLALEFAFLSGSLAVTGLVVLISLTIR